MVRLSALAAALLLCLQHTPAQETDRQLIIHVLNRVTFGPRPGDVEAVQKMGLRAFLDRQLHPETIDDSAVENELRSFELLQMSTQQLETVFLDDTKRALKKQQELQAAAGTSAPMAGAAESNPPMMENNGGAMAGEGGAMTPEAAPPTMNNFAAPTEGKGGWIEKVNAWRSVAAIGQLEQAKLVRAVDSQRQLQEVLVDFWSNHFNIDVKKGPCRVLKVADDRDVIRPHIWGKFRDLLEASAKSPAMLFYLDNAHQHGRSARVTPTRAADDRALADLMARTGDTAHIAPPSRGRQEEGRHQRELRPRNHGTPHPRRRRRLHAAGRAGSRALLHRLERSTAAPASSSSIPAA